MDTLLLCCHLRVSWRPQRGEAVLAPFGVIELDDLLRRSAASGQGWGGVGCLVAVADIISERQEMFSDLHEMCLIQPSQTIQRQVWLTL